MSLIRRGTFWHYEFMAGGKRYRGTTKQRTRARAEKVLAIIAAKAEKEALQLTAPDHAGEIVPIIFGRCYYSVTQYEDQMQRQGGKCAICGAEPRHLHWDHDHATGKLRSLLCPLCNRGIGQLGDSPERCDAAASYLRRHGK